MNVLPWLPVSNKGKQPMLNKRRRFKQTEPLQDRLVTFAKAARDKAEHLPVGIEREDIFRKARQADTAAHLDKWISSPGL